MSASGVWFAPPLEVALLARAEAEAVEEGAGFEVGERVARWIATFAGLWPVNPAGSVRPPTLERWQVWLPGENAHEAVGLAL